MSYPTGEEDSRRRPSCRQPREYANVVNGHEHHHESAQDIYRSNSLCRAKLRGNRNVNRCSVTRCRGHVAQLQTTDVRILSVAGAQGKAKSAAAFTKKAVNESAASLPQLKLLWRLRLRRLLVLRLLLVWRDFAFKDDPGLRSESLVVCVLDNLAHVNVSALEVQGVIGP